MNPGSYQGNFSEILSMFHANGGLAIQQDWYLRNSKSTFFNMQQQVGPWDFKVNANDWNHAVIVRTASSIKLYGSFPSKGSYAIKAVPKNDGI
jgi:hypothetical protein